MAARVIKAKEVAQSNCSVVQYPTFDSKENNSVLKLASRSPKQIIKANPVPKMSPGREKKLSECVIIDTIATHKEILTALAKI